MDRLQEFNQLVSDIKNHQCSLRPTCIQAVPGDGSIDSEVVFIGEGPGRQEDQQGRPFVGAAGQLLEAALNEIGWSRDKVYITNVVKCRPPGNRDPSPEEVEEHRLFLERELALIGPKLIVLLGRHALHWFLPGEQISKIRGTAKRRNEVVYFPTYHPAAALYNNSLKDTFVSDIKKIPLILKQLEASAPAAPTVVKQPSIFD